MGSKYTTLLLIFCASTLLLFQNCSKVAFNVTTDRLSSEAIQQTNSQVFHTKLNTPIDFTAELSDHTHPTSQASLLGQSKLSLPSGSTFEVIDAALWKFRYSPAFGFRGSEQATVLIKDGLGFETKDYITVIVDNPFVDLEPAIAVRTSACITCHAKVDSKYITDFGAGNDYFFGKQAVSANQNPFTQYPALWYVDRYDSGVSSWLSASFGQSIIVPDVPIGINLANYLDTTYPQRNATRLADYISSIENQKTAPAQVEVFSQVYIGAPSTDVINSRTQIGSAKIKFLKNSQSSPDLSGLIDRGWYFEVNSDGITCDGDLVLSEGLFLNNAKIVTDNGCRIYSTGSIFVNGAITYSQITSSATDNTNLQLVSSRWINLGVGTSHCETSATGGFYYQTGKPSPAGYRFDSTVGSVSTRAAPTSAEANALNQSLASELATITNFKDATCNTTSSGTGPRDVSYSRLLLNAPRIDSRYQGKVSGVIIAEVAMFALSRFSYSYDPVFSRVSVLPLLQTGDFLLLKK